MSSVALQAGAQKLLEIKGGKGRPYSSLVLIFFRKCDIFIKMKFDFFYFGLIEGFEPKTCDVKVKERNKRNKRTLGEIRLRDKRTLTSLTTLTTLTIFDYF